MPEAPPAPPPAAPEAPSTPVFDLAGSDAFGALDAIGVDSLDEGAPPAPPEKPAAPAKPTPPKGPDGRFLKEEKKAPDDKGKPPPKPAAIDFDKPPEKAADLRKHYDALKLEATARAEKLTAYEKRIAELEKATPKEWPEKKTYEERLADHQKRLAAYEEEMRYANYSKSEEYKDKFEKPYVNAYSMGRKSASGLKVIERKDPETGTITQAGRPGTAEDFDAIMRTRDPEAAADLASKLFGDARAAVILHHVENAKARAEEAENAIAEYREKGTKWESERREKMTQFQKQATDMIDGYTNAAIERFPQYFKPEDGDIKGNELLEKGQHLVKRVLANGAPIADGEEQMSGPEMAAAIASFRTKAGAFDRLFYKFREQGKQLAEAQKALKEYEASTPGEGEGSRAPAGGQGGEDDDPFKKLDSMARETPIGG